MSELSQRLKTAQKRRSGWSLRRIEEEMSNAGHPVSFATIGAYLRGDHGRPDESTLLAFAAVFPELDIVELRRLAQVPAGEVEPYDPPPEAHRLSRTQRQALNAVIAAMLEGDQGSTSARVATGPASPASLALAARKTGRRGASARARSEQDEQGEAP